MGHSVCLLMMPMLTGTRSRSHRPNWAYDAKDRLNLVLWNKIKSLISDTLADVLVILDCCYMSYLDIHKDERISRSSRAFEFLVAPNADSKVPLHGPASFASALIWALETLATCNVGFTASELSQKINNAPHFSAYQRPVLFDADQLGLRTIIIAPLGVEGGQHGTRSVKRLDIENDNLAVQLDLRLTLTKLPSNDDITNICKALKYLMDAGYIPVRHVEWGKLSCIEHVS